MRDIAEKIGVSHVAVSLALKDSPRISLKRRAEVKAVAEEMGYRPDPMLSSLAAYRQGKRPADIKSCIAWINQWRTPDDLRGFKEYDAYWQGAKASGEHLGYRLEEFLWPRGKNGKGLLKILRNRDVRGILLPPHRRGIDLPDFEWSGFSLVRFGVSVRDPQALCVTSDQSHCARLALNRVVEAGYKRIGYFTTERLERNTGGHFREGFLNAQLENVRVRDRVSPIEVDEDAPNVAKVEKWFLCQQPDALITTTSILSEFLKYLGLGCPEDVAVAGISVLDSNFDSGVDQNSYEIGRVAMNALCGMIMRNETGIPLYGRRILVEGRWVEGQSMPRGKPELRATLKNGRG